MRTIRLDPGDKIIVGVSGGADSLAMLHLLYRLHDEINLDVEVVHINHMIRGEAADQDARFVEQIADSWGLPCQIIKADVPEIAEEKGLSIEEAARKVRYTAFYDGALKFHAEYVAVAHHADDQAETILMHIIRGSGLSGLRGMRIISPLSAHHLLNPEHHQKTISLLRPMLDFSRSEIEAYCTENDLAYRIDESNADTAYTRNRIRHEVIPLLAEINPNICDSLGRLGMIAGADGDLLETQMLRAWREVVIKESDKAIRFHRQQWRGLHPGFQWRILRRAIMILGGTAQDIGYRQLETALKVAKGGETGSSGKLPDGLGLSVDYDEIIIHQEDHFLLKTNWPLLRAESQIEINQMGNYPLADGWAFHLSPYEEPRSTDHHSKVFAEAWSALLNADQLKLPLIIRTRRPGDRFQPQGVGGSKKLKDFQSDAKIPVQNRDHLPLLTTSDDKIIWVCGWRVDERFIVTEETQLLWLARFVKIDT